MVNLLLRVSTVAKKLIFPYINFFKNFHTKTNIIIINNLKILYYQISNSHTQIALFHISHMVTLARSRSSLSIPRLPSSSVLFIKYHHHLNSSIIFQLSIFVREVDACRKWTTRLLLEIHNALC